MWTRLGMLFAAVLVSLILTGAGQVRSASDGPENGEAARAVAVLTGVDDGPISEAVPADFDEVMGYAPNVVADQDGQARVIRPTGGCSTPFGSTTYDFARACKTHDYGYDLLRYAEKKDGVLGPWARIAIDDVLGDDLRRRCNVVEDADGCRTLAAVGIGAVKANSWRQAQGAPLSEDAGPYVASAVLIVAVLVAPPLVTRVRRARDRRTRVAGEAGSLAGAGSAT